MVQEDYEESPDDQYFNEEQIEELLDDDEISSEEAGFLKGYNDA